MIRTHIDLTEEELGNLTAIAKRRGVTIEAVLRAAVEPMLQEQAELRAKWDRLLATAGMFNSGHTDISVNHDLYLDEDYEP